MSKPDTPFQEEQKRLPYENLYYTQEDILFELAARVGFRWRVHRPHTVIGRTIGNAMNTEVTLAVYATICREMGELKRDRFIEKGERKHRHPIGK